jgi:hypothetical protein
MNLLTLTFSNFVGNHFYLFFHQCCSGIWRGGRTPFTYPANFAQNGVLLDGIREWVGSAREGL